MAIWAKRRGRTRWRRGRSGPASPGRGSGPGSQLGVGLALGARRRRRRSPGRSCGRACLPRPAVPGSGSGASAPARRPGRRRSGRSLRLTSRPIRSISSNGPMRKPPPRRTTRSIVAASATPSPSIRSDSSEKGRASRLATKPGLSLARIGVRPIRSATSVVAASACSEERSAATTSTSFISAGGLKKCMPTTRSGSGTSAAISVTAQRGGVGGEDRLRAAGLGQRGEQLALQLEVLGRRLDHQVAAGQVVELGRAPTRLDGGVAFGRAPALALDALGQGLAQPFAAASPAPPGSAS